MISIYQVDPEVNGGDVTEAPKKFSKTVDILLRMEPDMAARIDERRRLDPDLPSRQEVIRRILAAALYGDEADGDDPTS